MFTPIDKIAEVERSGAVKPCEMYSEPIVTNDVFGEQPRELPQFPKPLELVDGEFNEDEGFRSAPIQVQKPALPENAPEVPVTDAVPETVPSVQPMTAPVPEPEPQKVEGFSYISSRSLEKAKPAEQQPAEKPSVWTEKPKLRVVGEMFGVYIIAEAEDKTMIMIDKHAAHERIIFEDLKRRNCRQYSQGLITGVRVLLAGDDFSALEENTALLEDMGFRFDFSERPCAVATAVPTFIMELDMEEIIAEIAKNLRLHNHDPQSHALDDLLHTVACKSAIRGNDKNTPEELQALADRVYSDEAIRHCPHGRPVIFTLSKSNIERQFGRA